MTQKKLNNLAEAKSLAKVGHNMFVYLNFGYDITIPGDPTGEISRIFAQGFMEDLYEILLGVHAQGQTIPDHLPLNHGMKLDIRPWKTSILDGEIDGDR